MAELDLDALEQAAREAGGGCWFSAGWTVGSRGFEVGDLKSRNRICSDATERCAEFIAAANPATILELLGRLKAAEKERDSLRADKATLQWMTYSLKDRLEAAEKERDAAELMSLALRAKIAEMERQEPVAWGAFYFGGKLNGKLYSQCDTEAQIDMYIADRHQSDDSNTFRKAPLYALPGAKGEEK